MITGPSFDGRLRWWCWPFQEAATNGMTNGLDRIEENNDIDQNEAEDNCRAAMDGGASIGKVKNR